MLLKLLSSQTATIQLKITTETAEFEGKNQIFKEFIQCASKKKALRAVKGQLKTKKCQEEC